jgi:antitoxin component YwqK of YwqJK toxin-antitoxin module
MRSGTATERLDSTRAIATCCAIIVLSLLSLLPSLVSAQGFTRYTYHDADKNQLKEIFQVKDTIRNILHGRYISYFLNGNTESKGQFLNNETTGVWEFFYETGNVKMRGILRQNSNYGLWEYFYENGQRSMTGTINGRNREGEWKIYYESGDLKEIGNYTENKRAGYWKTFFEDGTLRGEIEYVDDHGRYTEYFHSGKVLAEGPKSGARNVGHWRFFAEDGTLESEGDYVNGKRDGDWRFQYPSGKTSATGRYSNDEAVGEWTYYYEDGTTSTKGKFIGGKKDGYWSTFSNDGSLKSEVTFDNGSGEYREYYPDKKLKVKGQVVEGQHEGKWSYYAVDGKLEGECTFVQGKGTYHGYYPSGTLQTKGQLENDMRVGTWELYEQDGKLSGYYKPVYEDQALANEITALVNKSKVPAPPAPKARKGFNYFIPRFPEYRGVIMEGNPLFSFVGIMPFAIEFYNQERLGHAFAFDGIRDPFYTRDSEVVQNVIFKRGYAISLRQKFYNPLKAGMWYFAHELRFTNVGYFSNIEFRTSGNLITVSASEQRAEYGILAGVRLMQRRNADGLTIDSFVGYSIGYRGFDVDPMIEGVFHNINQDNLAQSFRFGLNIGYCASFNRK